jgi:hypothetical protein
MLASHVSGKIICPMTLCDRMLCTSHRDMIKSPCMEYRSNSATLSNIGSYGTVAVDVRCLGAPAVFKPTERYTGYSEEIILPRQIRHLNLPIDERCSEGAGYLSVIRRTPTAPFTDEESVFAELSSVVSKYVTSSLSCEIEIVQLDSLFSLSLRPSRSLISTCNLHSEGIL